MRAQHRSGVKKAIDFRMYKEKQRATKAACTYGKIDSKKERMNVAWQESRDYRSPLGSATFHQIIDTAKVNLGW